MLPQLPPSDPSALGLCEEQSLMKTEAKYLLSTSGFSVSVVAGSSFSSIRGGTSSLDFLF